MVTVEFMAAFTTKGTVPEAGLKVFTPVMVWALLRSITLLVRTESGYWADASRGRRVLAVGVVDASMPST